MQDKRPLYVFFPAPCVFEGKINPQSECWEIFILVTEGKNVSNIH